MRFRIEDADFDVADIRHSDTQKSRAAGTNCAWDIWRWMIVGDYLLLTLVWMAPNDRVSLV